MKGLILLADGFEDTEGITTRDILMRGGLIVETASISNSNEVITSHKLKLKTDVLLKDINLNDYLFLILPGGLKGVENLSNSDLVKNAIKYFFDNKKDVYAICAAPSILGKMGYLDNKPFTCYPGFEKGIKGKYTGEGVTITDNHIITGKAMAYSIDFALEILRKVLGVDSYNHVKQTSKGL